MSPRHLIAALVLLGACSGSDDDVQPQPDLCLVAPKPAAVSVGVELEGEGDAIDVTATCEVRDVVHNDSETRIFLIGCVGDTSSATIAIGAQPPVTIDLRAGDDIAMVYEYRRPDFGPNRRIVLRRDDGAIAVAALTGPAIPEDEFFAPLRFGAVAAECPLVRQSCFDAEKRVIQIERGADTLLVPSRHIADEGDLHVRVEQADGLVNQVECINLPPAWYDFLVAIDRAL